MARILSTLAALVLVLGALLVAIAKRPAPSVAPSPPAPHDDRGKAAIVVNVVSIDRDAVTGIYGGGTYRFKLAPGAPVPADLQRGEAVLAHCRLTSGGGWVMERAERHHGLPLDYGTVTRRDAGSLVMKTPFGDKTFEINADSYVPDKLKPGDFIAVKYYHLGEARTVLSCLLMPGCSVEEGVVSAIGPASFSLRGLRGVVTFAVKPDGIAVGDAVTFRYRLEDNDRVEPIGIERRDGKFTFTGKLVQHAPQSRTVTVIDVLGNMGDSVDFRYDGNFKPLDEARPGDLLRVTYELSDAGARLLAVRKEPLPPVFFGTITHIDENRLTLVTRQGQTKEVRLSSKTTMPVRVKAGDMADVIYREEAGALPLATTVVKE